MLIKKIHFVILLLFTLSFSAKAAFPDWECHNATKVATTGKIHLPEVKSGGRVVADEVHVEFWVRRCEEKIDSNGTEIIKYSHNFYTTITPVVPGKSNTATQVAVIQNNKQESIDYLSTDDHLYVPESYLMNRKGTDVIDYGKPFTLIVSCSSTYAKYCPADHKKTFKLSPNSNTGSTEKNEISSVSGTWYDPAYNGSGFNISEAANGLLFTFYGYKANTNGVAQWLISSVGPTSVRKSQSITLNVYQPTTGNGASFATKPSKDSGLSEWGTATLTFSNCNAGTITLNGKDGNITHNIVKLSNVKGLICKLQ